MRVAASDLGSNSFLCLVAEIENGRITKVVDDLVELVRLGQDVDKTKSFHADALIRADAALQKFSRKIEFLKPDRVLAMATSAARDVTNAQALFDICSRHNIPVEIIPGGQEARITYMGATSNENFQSYKPRLVIDIGGGSTEFIFGIGTHLHWGHSLDLGVVRMKERLVKGFPVSDADFKALELETQRMMKDLFAMKGCPGPKEVTEIVAVAGTPTELARVEIGGEYSPEKIDGHKLNHGRLLQWTFELKKRTPEQITKDFGVKPGRADVLMVGALILFNALRNWNLMELTVSTRGVRYGVALDLARR